MDFVDILNERLIDYYGNEKNTGLPKYRLVRSEVQTEKRYGSYDIVTQESGIWLGTNKGLVEVKKYWYIEPCWLLERIELNLNRKDVIHEKYTYEPLFPFLDKDNNPLDLNWKVLEFFLNRLEKAERQFLTEADHQAEEDKRLQDEQDKVFGILDKPDPIKELPTFTASTLIPKG